MRPPPFDYPLFAVQASGKREYAAVEGPSPRDQKRVAALAIWTKRAMAEKHVAERGQGTVEALRTAEEFRLLLWTLESPTACVAFDPVVRADGQLMPRSMVEIDDVLALLPEPGFIWSYPVFVIDLGGGDFAVLDGVADNGAKALGVVVFTDGDLARRFQEATGLKGKIQALNDDRKLVDFVVERNVQMVLFDVRKTSGGLSASYEGNAADVFDIPR